MVELTTLAGSQWWFISGQEYRHGCGDQNCSYKKELSAQSYTTEGWGQITNEQEECVQALISI